MSGANSFRSFLCQKGQKGKHMRKQTCTESPPELAEKLLGGSRKGTEARLTACREAGTMDIRAIGRG